MATHVVEYLKADLWDVYQEVQVGSGGDIADIVAVQGPVIWVIECKLSLSLDLIAQVRNWTGRAHRVSAAVPARKKATWAQQRLVMDILDWSEVGLIRVKADGSAGVREELMAPLHRTAKVTRLRASLCDEQRTFAQAGNSDGRRWTPFQRTCSMLRAHVAANPGITLKDALTDIDHHYAHDKSATQSLSHLLREGVVDGLELRRDGRSLTLHLKDKVTVD